MMILLYYFVYPHMFFYFWPPFVLI